MEGIAGLDVLAALAAAPLQLPNANVPQTLLRRTAHGAAPLGRDVPPVSKDLISIDTCHQGAAERRKRRLHKIRGTKGTAKSALRNRNNTPEPATVSLDMNDDSTSSEEARVMDEREFKKQQRMIRNRQSAALSRKRKADRISSLESRVESLEQENFHLRARLERLAHFEARMQDVS